MSVFDRRVYQVNGAEMYNGSVVQHLFRDLFRRKKQIGTWVAEKGKFPVPGFIQGDKGKAGVSLFRPKYLAGIDSVIS